MKANTNLLLIICLLIVSVNCKKNEVVPLRTFEDVTEEEYLAPCQEDLRYNSVWSNYDFDNLFISTRYNGSNFQIIASGSDNHKIYFEFDEKPTVPRKYIAQPLVLFLLAHYNNITS